MQFAVPQFTDVEDKLIGPLTLKQFLFIMATAGIIFFFYSLLKFSIFFFLFAIPVAVLGAAVAFGSFNGRPFYGYLGAFVSFVTKPQARIFKREEVPMMISTKKTEPVALKTEISGEQTESRLKKLAYLLDQKTKEEADIIEHGTDNR